jgi:hypothetical protein
MHRQLQRSRQIERALAKGPVDVAHVVGQLFPGLSAVEAFLAFSEVLGHLLELERRGRVSRKRAGSREHWRTTARR